MTTLEPSFSVNIDMTNPGQFFACCGLLELAHRLDHRALGWFDTGRLNLASTPSDLLQQFLACEVEPLVDVRPDTKPETQDGSEKREGKTTPIWLAAPFDLRLDWWNSSDAQEAKLKTWSAGQKVTDLFIGKTSVRRTKKGDKTTYSPSMRDHLRESSERDPVDWLRVSGPIESPKSFCFDSRLSRNNALDLGHVGGNTMAFSPAVDVLAVVGLQRFRPRVIETWSRNRYCTWSQPLPADIAAVVTLGLIPQLIDSCFEFPVKRRDAPGRYKLFGHAQPVRRPS